jgi:hypothetical protein
MSVSAISKQISSPKRKRERKETELVNASDCKIALRKGFVIVAVVVAYQAAFVSLQPMNYGIQFSGPRYGGRLGRYRTIKIEKLQNHKLFSKIKIPYTSYIFTEKLHAYEVHAREMHAYEVHAVRYLGEAMSFDGMNFHLVARWKAGYHRLQWRKNGALLAVATHACSKIAQQSDNLIRLYPTAF